MPHWPYFLPTWSFWNINLLVFLPGFQIYQSFSLTFRIKWHFMFFMGWPLFIVTYSSPIHSTYSLYLEKAMAPHSSTLAWKIPWMEEPGRLQSMGAQRVGHYWVTSLSFFTFMHWRRKWQPTPVFLPGESQGQWSLVGRSLWGRTESDTTEVTY